MHTFTKKKKQLRTKQINRQTLCGSLGIHIKLFSLDYENGQIRIKIVFK